MRLGRASMLSGELPQRPRRRCCTATANDPERTAPSPPSRSGGGRRVGQPARRSAGVRGCPGCWGQPSPGVSRGCEARPPLQAPRSLQQQLVAGPPAGVKRASSRRRHHAEAPERGGGGAGRGLRSSQSPTQAVALALLRGAAGCKAVRAVMPEAMRWRADFPRPLRELEAISRGVRTNMKWKMVHDGGKPISLTFFRNFVCFGTEKM